MFTCARHVLCLTPRAPIPSINKIGPRLPPRWSPWSLRVHTVTAPRSRHSTSPGLPMWEDAQARAALLSAAAAGQPDGTRELAVWALANLIAATSNTAPSRRSRQQRGTRLRRAWSTSRLRGSASGDGWATGFFSCPDESQLLFVFWANGRSVDKNKGGDTTTRTDGEVGSRFARVRRRKRQGRIK